MHRFKGPTTYTPDQNESGQKLGTVQSFHITADFNRAHSYIKDLPIFQVLLTCYDIIS